MTLLTDADLALRSPISIDLGEYSREQAVSLIMADLTGIGLLHLRGNSSALRAGIGDLPEEIGEVLPGSDRLAARLTDDEWILVTPDRAQVPITKGVNSLITLTDVSHGYATLLVAGPQALRVLAKLCALDFSEGSFPDLHAAQTSLANVRALVLRRDLPDQRAYLIAVGRSFSEYVWGVLLDAAREFDPSVRDSAGWIPPLIKGTRE